MWRKYFGNEALLFGVDIDAHCARNVNAPNEVRIGSQDDPAFLMDVVRQMGGIDVVLDDGSHIGRHQIASFDALFPMLSNGGLYIIEDTHTSYWRAWEGGFRRRGTAIEFIKDMIDDLHGWYHGHNLGTPAKDEIAAIHVYDSITVIEKRKKGRPWRITVGREP